MKKMKSKKKVFLCVILAIFLLLGSIILANSNGDSIQTNGNISLSTKKIEWGIKRGTNHEQPDLGT